MVNLIYLNVRNGCKWLILFKVLNHFELNNADDNFFKENCKICHTTNMTNSLKKLKSQFKFPR